MQVFVQKLEINGRDNSGATPLHMAAKGGHLNVIKYLLGVQADLHTVDNAGNNCLHFSAMSGNKDTFCHFEQLGVECKKNNNGQMPQELVAASHPQQNTILITPASGAAQLSEQSRRPASNQPAADRAVVDPPFPAKSRSRQKYLKILK